MKLDPFKGEKFLAARAAMLKWTRRAGRFWESVDQGLRRWKLSSKGQTFLHLIRTARDNAGRLPWSCPWVRQHATEALIDVFLDDFHAHQGRKRWFATFTWNDGLTWEREPRVDIIALCMKVYKALAEYGLEGMGVVEVDVFKQRAGEPGRRHVFHVHVYFWEGEGTTLAPDNCAAALMATSRFQNELGAPSVDFRAVTLTAADVARIAGYMGKFPSKAKNLVPSRKRPGKFVTRHAKMRGDSAVRLLEVLSHLEPFDVFFGVGPGGKRLRAAWREKFLEDLGYRPGRRLKMDKDHDIGASWREIRADNGSKRMKPLTIITRPAQRHDRSDE